MFQPNKQEQEMFNALSQTGLCAVLVSYLERLVSTMCDIRTLTGVKEEERLGRLEAIKVIEEHIIKPLRLQRSDEKKELNQYT